MMHLQILNIWLSTWLSGLTAPPELYLVGGSVRDLLLNKVPADIDIVCRGAQGVAEQLAAQHHATVIQMEKKPYQPCYRVADHLKALVKSPAYIDIAECRGSSIDDDLRLRDFTINAIAMWIKVNGASGAIIDPLDGAGDLLRRRVRMTHTQAFDNDPLRILRAFRFAADLGFEIDEATLDAMKHAVPSLAGVSVERIMNELFLTFRTPEASSAVAALDSYGILDSIFPDIIMIKGCNQNGYHHKDVWGHSLLVVERLEDILNNPGDYFDDAAAVFRNLETDARLPLLKLAALLHDVGKPGTKGLNQETGRITFKQHDRVGAERVDRIAKRMKLSGQARTFLVRMVREHLQPIFLSAASGSSAARMRWFRQMGDDAVPALILSMADVMSSRGPLSGEEYRCGFVAWCRQQVNDYYVSVKTILERQVLITGRDLMALGMTPGPQIGRILGQVKEAQDTGDIASRDEALTLVRKLIEMYPS